MRAREREGERKKREGGNKGEHNCDGVLISSSVKYARTGVHNGCGTNGALKGNVGTRTGLMQFR